MPRADPKPSVVNKRGQDIVVTAQRRRENLEKTPIAVTALTSAMLQQRGVVKLENIASSTPSLNISPVTASPNAIMISMRGALEQNGGTITSESPVAIYIDDVYQSRLSAANFDLADISRIEVLRGPQGTLYGRNSMTGAIKLITRQPDGSKWYDGDISYATFEEVKAKASIGVPLGDHLALAASGFYDNRNKGWEYDEVTNRRVGVFKRYGGQVSLGIYDVPGLEAVLTGRYSAGLSDGQYYIPMNLTTGGNASGGFYNTRTPRQPDGDTRQKSVSLHLGYDIGGVKLRSITAYQHLSDYWALDFSGGYDSPFTGTTIAGFFRSSDGKQHQFTQELQALGTAFDGRMNWIVGAFYYDEKAQQSFLHDDLAAFFLTYGPSSFRTTSTSLAGYAQADYKVFDHLTASAGIRFTRDRKRFDGLSPSAPGLAAPLVASAFRTNANVWTPKFNLQWDISPTAMVYGTVSRGYRAGGFNSLVIADPAHFGYPYKPESVWSYEAGFKIQPFNRRARLNVAAYTENLSDLQTLRDAGGGSFITENAAESRIWGVEWEASVNPVRGLSFYFSGAYTGDKYTKLDPATQAAQLGVKHLAMVSRWQYQLGGSYDMPLGNIGSLSLAADYNYRGPFFTQPALYAQSKVRASEITNGSITYKTPEDKMELYVQATNLFNIKRYNSALVFIPGVFGELYPIEPRVVRAGFRFKF